MKRKLLILITVLGLAVSAGLFTACEKIDNDANFAAARAVLEEKGFSIVDIPLELTQPMYPGVVKGFSAGSLASGTYESVTVFLLTDQKALDYFIKVRKGKYIESYTRGLIYYGGGTPELAESGLSKSAAQYVYDVIGGAKTG